MESNLRPIPNDSPASIVMLVPIEKPANTPKRVYAGINRSITSIRALSGLIIALGVLTVVLQVAAFKANPYPSFSSDVAVPGIWGGAFYIITGSLGLRSASEKTRGPIVATVVFGSFSIFSSFSSAMASGFSASYSYCPMDHYYYCELWRGLEWFLMTCCILACCDSIALIIFIVKALRKGRAKYYQMFAIQPSASHHGCFQPSAPYVGPPVGYVQKTSGMNYCTQALIPVSTGGMHSSVQVHQSPSCNNTQPAGSQQGSENVFQEPMALKEINKKLHNF